MDIEWNDISNLKSPKIIVIARENKKDEKSWSLFWQLYHSHKKDDYKFLFMGSKKGFEMVSDILEGKEEKENICLKREKEWMVNFEEEFQKQLNSIHVTKYSKKILVIFEIKNLDLITTTCPEFFYIFFNARHYNMTIVILANVSVVSQIHPQFYSNIGYFLFTTCKKENELKIRSHIQRITGEEMKTNEDLFMKKLVEKEMFEKTDIVFGMDKTARCEKDTMFCLPVIPYTYLDGLYKKSYTSLSFKKSIYRWEWIKWIARNNLPIESNESLQIYETCKKTILSDHFLIYWLLRRFLPKDIILYLFKNFPFFISFDFNSKKQIFFPIDTLEIFFNDSREKKKQLAE